MRHGRPAPRRLLPSALALVVAGAACGDDGSGAETDAGTGGSAGTGEGLPRPTFSEPASGRLSLASNRTTDVQLTIANVMLGQTTVILDGRDLGPMREGSRVGLLGSDQLRLRLRGTLVPGLHELQLRTTAAELTEESEVIEVSIAGESTEPPTATLGEPVVPGRKVLTTGDDDDALLLVLDDADPEGPRLHLLPRLGDRWDPAEVRTVAVPGLALGPGERILPAVAIRHGDGGARLRVAWRVGQPGARIDLLETAWDDATPELEPSTSLTTADALAGDAAEWAQLGRPWLLEDLLLAELWAPVDVEAARPGDRRLVWSRVQEGATGLDPVQRVSVRADLVDLDKLGPMVDLISAETDGPPGVSIRADQHQALALEYDPQGGGLRARPTVDDGRRRTFSFVDAPLVTISGALGSRTIAGFTAASSGRLRVALIDDLRLGASDETSLGTSDLPAFDGVTGELAPASVQGTAVFLLPYGADTPTQAMYVTGLSVRVKALEALTCDSVALPGFAVAAAELPLACIHEGQLHLGTLGLEPAG